MPLPDSLYYRKKELKKQYTSQPTGKLDVSRALENNPSCWRKVDLSNQKLPKKIVINDSLENPTPRDIRQYESYIKELLEQGFEVYILFEDGPLRITKDNSGALHVPYYQEHMIQSYNHNIIEYFEKLKIPRNQIKRIDWKELTSLHHAMQATDEMNVPQPEPSPDFTFDNAIAREEDLSMHFSQMNETVASQVLKWRGLNESYRQLIDSVTFSQEHDPLELNYSFVALDTFSRASDVVFEGEFFTAPLEYKPSTFVDPVNSLTLRDFRLWSYEGEVIDDPGKVFHRQLNCFAHHELEHLCIERCETVPTMDAFNMFANGSDLKTCVLIDTFNDGALPLTGLAKTPNLQYFRLDGSFFAPAYFVDFESNGDEDFSSYTLEHLVEINLPFDTSIDGLEILLKRCPNLIKLTCCLPSYTEALADSLAGTVSLDLFVNDVEHAQDMLRTLNQAMSSIKELKVESWSEDVIVAMCGSWHTPDFYIPNLETFICHAEDCWDVLWLHGHEYQHLRQLEVKVSSPRHTWRALAETLKAPNLKAIKVTSYAPLPIDSLDALTEIMRVMVKYGLEEIAYDWVDQSAGTHTLHVKYAELKQILTEPHAVKPAWYTMMVHEKAQGRKSTLGDKIGSQIGDEVNDNDTSFESAGIPRNLGTSESIIKVDAKTQADDSELDAVKIFKGLNCDDPDVSEYRLSVFNELEEKRFRAKPFNLSFKGEPTYEAVTSFEYGEEAVKTNLQSGANDAEPCVLGAIVLTLSDEWIALPSLQSNDELLALSVSGMDRDDLEIRFHQQKKLYEIRKKFPGSRQVHCEMVLKCPVQTPQKSAAIESLVEYFREFTNEALDLDLLPEKYDGLDLLDAIIDQKKGVCSHRAVGFFKKAAKEHPDLNVNMVFNDVHAYVEIEMDGQFCKFDLGGAPANVHTHEPPVFKVAEVSAQAATSSAAGKSEEAQSQGLELDQRHTTWKQTKTESAKAVCLEAIAQVSKDSHTGQDYGHNVLIQCKDDRSADLIALQLQHDATHTNRPVFVIDSPDLVSCARKRMQRQHDGTGKPVEGGGPLYDFLTQDFKEGDKPVLIINWNLLNPEDVVRLNSLIDEHRSADGTDIPREMVVVGVYNTKSPDAYKGSDFYSRNEVKYTIPVAHDLDASLFDLDIAELENQDSDLISIELYDSDDWKDLLLGQWVIDEGKVVFKQGPLLDALEAGKGVHLANAPWDDPDFKRFWQQLEISGVLYAFDRTYAIPDSFWSNLRQSKGYDWHAFDNIAFVDQTSELQNPLVLNGATVSEYFNHTRVDDSHPVQALSKFADFAGQRVDLIMTETLPWQLWYQLLTEASRYQVALNLAVPEGVKVPLEVESNFDVKRLIEPLQPAIQVIQSSDPDFAVVQLKEHKDWYPDGPPSLIDISDLEPEDVFFGASFDIDELTIQIKLSQVWELINSGQDVILKGQFTPEVAQHLQILALEQSLHMHGNQVPFKGSLVLVSDQPLSPAIATLTVESSLNEKLNWLINEHEDHWDDELIEAIEAYPWPAEISMEALKASVEYYQRSDPPSFDYLAPIEKEISIQLSPELLQDEEQLQRRHAQCINQRYKDLRAILDTGPMAFIAGPTGVGKSTFIEKYLTPEMGYLVHHSLEQVKAWAQDKTEDKTKILFIDEANISTENYRMFEGLLENPPFIIIDGEIIELDHEHEVVFAGNPLSYGGERNLPSLIARHGCICTFEPLPPATIQLEMIEPILSETIQDLNLQIRISEAILKAYVEICQYSQSEVLVSPRELKMMAMMIAASDNPAAEYEAIVYKVASQALPQRYQARFASWSNKYLPAYAHQSKVEPNSPADSTFILTDSRKPIYQTLGQMLHVRENLVLNSNSKISAAGLGGMLLEGEPGTGKSHFYMDALRDYGYKQVLLDKMATDDTKAFVFIPASMDFEQKAEKLVEAFEQGLIVVTDEINSGPALEQLLNSLLMGQHPDKTKDPSTIKPGFQLLGTQNPISMGHREATSGAIARRMMKFEFNAYTNEEMAEILKASFPLLTDKTIEKHVRLHVEHKQYAKAHDKEPIPVFRDLYKLMDNKHQAKLCNMVSASQPKARKVGVFAARQMVRDLKKRQMAPTKVEGKLAQSAPTQTKAKKQST